MAVMSDVWDLIKQLFGFEVFQSNWLTTLNVAWQLIVAAPSMMHVPQDPLACFVLLRKPVFSGKHAAMSPCHMFSVHLEVNEKNVNALCKHQCREYPNPIKRQPKEKKSNKLQCYVFKLKKKEKNCNNNNHEGYKN